MNIEERLDEAMRATANSVEPPVTDLVDGGLARGRRKRRRRVVVATGGALAATALVAGGAVALPDLMAGSPDVVADSGHEEAAEGVEPQTAPDPTADQLAGSPDIVGDVGDEAEGVEPQTAPDRNAEQTPLVIEDPVGALLEDLAALSGGRLEPFPVQSVATMIRLDFDDLGVATVSADSVSDVMPSGNPCDYLSECEVLLDADAAVVAHAEMGFGSRLTYLTDIGSQNNLMVSVDMVEVPEGTTAADLGFDDANELRDAVLAVVPDAESAERGEYTADELDEIAREVAGLSTATLGELVQLDGPNRSGRVSFGESAGFEIRIAYHVGGSDLAVWAESCERGASDGKPCTELVNTGEVGVFASTYPNQGNRESLRYVADLGDGSLVIVFDNYMETASGSKVVGSSISDAGIDPDELVAVVENSGLLDD